MISSSCITVQFVLLQKEVVAIIAAFFSSRVDKKHVFKIKNKKSDFCI